MTPTATYTKNSDYVQCDVAGEYILVPIRRTLTEANSIYVLNETGAALWNRIDGQRTAQDIVTGVCGEYEVATDQLTKDFTPLLDDLLFIQAVGRGPDDSGLHRINSRTFPSASPTPANGRSPAVVNGLLQSPRADPSGVQQR